MPWVHKGLANNHKICDKSIEHGMVPKIFWGPNGPGGRDLSIVLEVHVFGLKHNRLEPDGWLVRIRRKRTVNL